MNRKTEKIAAPPASEQLFESEVTPLNESQLANIERLRLLLRNPEFAADLMYDNRVRGDLKAILVAIDPRIGCEIHGDYDCVDEMFLPGAKLVLNGAGSLDAFLIAERVVSELILAGRLDVTAQLNPATEVGNGTIHGDEMPAADACILLWLFYRRYDLGRIAPITLDVVSNL